MQSVPGSLDRQTLAIEKKERLDRSFRKKGMLIALYSGIAYGLYSAFILLAQTRGIWAEWAGSIDPAGFLAIFILPTIAAALNDTISAVWALATTAVQGKMGDFLQTFRSKPGIILVVAALVGGPLAATAYVIALNLAGPIITPIAALNPAFGSILARIFLKQDLGPRTVLGILICVLSGGIIGFAGLSGDLGPNILPGLLLGLLAALGWGIEGCIGGFGTSMIDSQVAITIRQVTSGSMNLVIMLPLLSLIGGVNLGDAYGFVAAAVTNGPSVVFFVISGFFAYTSFANWYRGNSMCGTALGMACNSSYSFFVPLFSWILLGVVFGMDGFALPPSHGAPRS